jgi:hypothetical protein
VRKLLARENEFNVLEAADLHRVIFVGGIFGHAGVA